MAKYTLVAVDAEKQNQTIINVTDQKDGKEKAKVSLADIDQFTSDFLDVREFITYLNKIGAIKFTDGYAYIMSEYAGETYTFKCIYNSKLINESSKNVSESKIDYKNANGCLEFCQKIMIKLENDKEYLEKVQETKYIKPSLKTKIINYVNLYNNNDKREEELRQQNALKDEIYVELLTYKTFRGIYIFDEKAKQVVPYRQQRQIRPQNEVRRQPVVPTETIEEMINKVQVDPNNLANLNYGDEEKEEFITPEEYEDSYGKGGKHVM